MVINQITDTDEIILNSVESYLKKIGTPVGQNGQEQLYIMEQARDYLYSDIAQRVPRVAAYILSADMENDKYAKGLFLALSKHALDPVFIDILMQYLTKINSPEENGVTGALLVKIMNKYIDQNWKEPTKPKKGEKGSEAETSKNDTSLRAIEHIQKAVNQLLGQMSSIIRTRCGNITQSEASAIAACIAMNNKQTITEIINSDLPITAQIFDVLSDPSVLIKSALLIEKTEFPKLSTNQSAFVESLKRWVYDKLNVIPTQTSYQFLVATYGSRTPDVSKYLIQIKDCGTQYSNLLIVAKQLVNQ